MEILRQTFTEYQIYGFSTLLENWMYVISGGLLFIEILKFLFKKLMNWKLAGDGVANFVTYVAFVLLYYIVLGSVVHNSLLFHLLLCDCHHTHNYLVNRSLYRAR